MRRLMISLLMVMAFASTAFAQSVVPTFRYFVSPDMDFYGADLDSLFDTDLNSCERACNAMERCQAFTFNTRSNSCFPKSTVTDRQSYTGAVSAEKRRTSPAVLAQAEARAARLQFLRSGDLNNAFVAGRDIGFWHRAGAYTLEEMVNAARARTNAGDLVAAMRWTGGAISASDQADLWAEYARLLLRIETNQSSQRRKNRSRAISAAINAYMRSPNAGGQASALHVLADALEASGRGRDMIPALRLAQELQPREDIVAALDAAVAKYGFRITDTSVESDVAAPRICAEFSEPLIKVGTDYEPFVQLPDGDLSVQAEDRQLCVDGVEHGKRYRFTLREGLPAASGETLYKDVELTLYVRDRSPSVRFPGRSYVLPKTADAALPVETVNATKLELRLRQVSDRNLLRAVQDGYFGRPLSQYQEEEFSRDIAQEVWTGTAEVGTTLNRDVLTRLPMAAAIAGRPAGIYALSARIPGADPYDDPAATQWFVLSDLGLSTQSGTDGLHVVVRGLSDAQARADVEVTLVSRANAVLATATTDGDGIAHFEPGLVRGRGASSPAMILATAGAQDVGFLSLTDPAFDLSDRGVEGRAPAQAVDVFLTTDRGAYRAGETINATVLARDPQVQAIEGLPLIAILKRPDGVEYSRQISGGGLSGGHVFAMQIGGAVPRGSWRLDIKSDPDAPPLATQTVLVEDFLPERIDFDLGLPGTALRPGDAPPLTVDARYLFGAPGADLSIEGQVTVRPASDLADWPGYRFGRYDETPGPRSTVFGGTRTGPDGRATVLLELPQMEDTGQPMTATVVTRVADGSARPVEREISAPVLPTGDVIGIKPLFDDVVGEGQDARFEVIGLTPELRPQPMRVKWTLNRVQTRYQWYQLYGNWKWEPTTRRSRVATGEIEIGLGPVMVAHPVDWGHYELVVERIGAPYAASATDFYAGWYAPADASSTPDRLDMSLDRRDYRPGDTAQLRLVPRMAGTAMITVMADKVIARQVVEVEPGESLVPLPVTDAWGTGAYVTATLIRPMDAAAGQTPARALGVAYATVVQPEKRLSVSIDVPEVARPRQSQTARVRVDGAAPGDQVWLTLAAVDVGILNLTRFQSPDPTGYYFGQRRLGVELRDVYGRLIDGLNGATGVVRSGGDGDAGARLQSPPPTQDLMSTFSGPLPVGPDGVVEVPVTLPAFNGTVRLMAVAWNRVAVGEAEAEMFVRDPVVVTANVPRFLAPGDRSRIQLDVVHADGPTGQMQLVIDNIGAGLQVDQTRADLFLDAKAKAVIDLPVRATAVGDPSFDVVLTTPDGRQLRQTLRLPVRANDPEIAVTRRFSLAAGDSFTFSQDVFAELRPGTGSALLSAGPLARFDAPGLLSSLDRYPYGCTEQVTSRAMPLLYLSSVAQASGLGSGPDVQARVDAAIARVLSRQAASGSFGLWRAASGDFWLDAYVSDFLSRARAQGYVVPDLAFRTAMDNLRNRVNYAPDFDDGGEDIAYALLVLAREGAAAMGDLRYYADVKAGSFATPLAVAQVGAALAAYGDQTRADAMFRRAGRMVQVRRFEEDPVWRADYGTNRRDAAAVLALVAEAGSRAINADDLSQRVSTTRGRLSTQEASWSLMAAQALIANPESSGLLVNGRPLSGPFVKVVQDSVAEQVTLSSQSGRDTAITLTTIGVPQVPPGPGGNGFEIVRQYYSMEGQERDGLSFAVGERFVTVITVIPFEDIEGRLMIDDPLPAGIEIDNPNLLRSGDIGALDWLQSSDTEYSEFRSDRFLAAVNKRFEGPVRLAYVARAVTPGSYHHPAVSVEDMYRPAFRARSASGRVTVTE